MFTINLMILLMVASILTSAIFYVYHQRKETKLIMVRISQAVQVDNEPKQEDKFNNLLRLIRGNK